MSKSIILLIISLLPFAFFLGCIVLLTSVAKSSKKYRALLQRLKNQGEYEEWTNQHKDLVFLERIYRYFGISVVLLALTILVIEFASIPKIFVTILEVVGYIYWPLAFLFLITISKLYKKVPELQD